MDYKIILVYCLCAAPWGHPLKALQHKEDVQCKISDAEVMTVGLVAALFFGGKHTLACAFLCEQKYIPRMISKSQFSRRLHRLDYLFITLFQVLGEAFKELNEESVYIIGCPQGAAPIAVCDNIRIKRNKIYGDEAHRGYQASKKRYFSGVKIHLLVTKDHQPVEFFLSPDGFSDTDALTQFDFDLPAGSQIFGDKAYTDYLVEDLLDEADIQLVPDRKKNSKRPMPPWLHFFLRQYRNQVETAGSLHPEGTRRLLPKSIHAVTAKGFALKVILFVLASSINCLG